MGKAGDALAPAYAGLQATSAVVRLAARGAGKFSRERVRWGRYLQP